MHRLDDRVLRVVAGEAGDADGGDGADEERPVSPRHVLAQSAHAPHVLLVMHGDDHRAGGEEEQRLEERVRHEVENRGGIGGGAERDGHVAQLRERRIRHHALDVVLRERDERHEERGDRADDQHH